MNITMLIRNAENEISVKSLRKAVEAVAIEIFQNTIIEHIYMMEKKDADFDIKFLLSERPAKKSCIKAFDQKVNSLYKESFPGKHSYKVVVEVKTNIPKTQLNNTTKTITPLADKESEDIFSEARIAQFMPVDPNFNFDSVILNDSIKNRITDALNVIKFQDLINNQWGLKTIKPNSSAALNFYGPSGTGKTMAAEAVASYLGKKILIISSADMESKYHGESQKNVQAIFATAQDNDAVLFFDEADSFLSRRFGNPSNSSDQSVNQTRSQFLIELENFKGIAIFATNLCKNYDEAFKTRLINIKFELPDEECRKKIWAVHTRGKGLNIPFTEEVDTDELAKAFDNFAGRDIRNAVYQACCAAAPKGIVSQADLVFACTNIANEKVETEKNEKIDVEMKSLIMETKKRMAA